MIPDIVSTYFRAADAVDLDALAACFTHDATVTDEGMTIRGHAAIRRWREEIAAKWRYTVTVLGSEPRDGDHHAVRALLEGNFPGGRVELTFDFGLHDGHIASLAIA
jgi:ketosteroid isomerase-like protein